jgi:hypothetical protein
MKPVLTKEEVGKAISRLIAEGKKPTLAALHTALDNKGSMSTLVRLKAEIEAVEQPPTDSPDALQAFRKIWTVARDEGRKEQEQALVDMRDNLRSLAVENERLEGIAAAAKGRAADLEQAKIKADTELETLRTNTERDLALATATVRDAGLQAAKALQELADTRGAQATQLAALHAELALVQLKAHNFELQLVRTGALLEAKGLLIETQDS